MIDHILTDRKQLIRHKSMVEMVRTSQPLRH